MFNGHAVSLLLWLVIDLLSIKNCLKVVKSHALMKDNPSEGNAYLIERKSTGINIFWISLNYNIARLLLDSQLPIGANSVN